jgi:hypothetical protein
MTTFWKVKTRQYEMKWQAARKYAATQRGEELIFLIISFSSRELIVFYKAK